MVPAGQQEHVGTHSCDTRAHCCQQLCPTCGYICELAFGHSNEHQAKHGNMIKTHFVSSGKNIDLDGRLYEAGETGAAESCSSFCNKLGRHIHILPCETQGSSTCAPADKGGRRHANVKYLLDPENPKDELTHEGYWHAIGFCDPCSAEHGEIFKLCNFECGENHMDEGRCKCMLPLWHAHCGLQVNEEKKFESKNPNSGYASSDGHIFIRKHGPPENIHIVFCLDASTSMSKRNRWQTLVRGVEQFISARNRQGDIYSVVLFSGEGNVICDMKSPGNARATIADLPKFGRDTKFSSGLSVAYRQLMKTRWDEYRAALIFMSDGEDENSEWESSMLNIKQLAEQKPHALLTFVIGIGDGFNTKKLQSVATVGNTLFLTVDAVCANLGTVLQRVDSNVNQLVALMKQPAHTEATSASTSTSTSTSTSSSSSTSTSSSSSASTSSSSSSSYTSRSLFSCTSTSSSDGGAS
ncbi:Sterol 3-beta-glucosyltransferase [Pelomyxa schiedti]|nr:Sterol 3-beta-glucosyltransferase [Pelomyxa schiedti]